MTQVHERTRQDCNWLVAQTETMRKGLMHRRLVGVVGLEKRLAVKIAVRLMDYNELRAATI